MDHGRAGKVVFLNYGSSTCFVQNIFEPAFWPFAARLAAQTPSLERKGGAGGARTVCGHSMLLSPASMMYSTSDDALAKEGRAL